MVLQIAVVDDEQDFRNMLCLMINDWAQRMRRDVQISTYVHGDSFLFDWEDAPPLDVIFLDIKMPGPDGMQVAKRIRESNKDVMLVFATNWIERVLESFQYGATRFLLKPVQQQDLDECLKVVWDSIDTSQQNTYLFRCEGHQVRVPYREIIYIENSLQYVTLHTAGKQYTYLEAMKNIELAMPRQFVRCHRSFIINIDYVHSLDTRELALRDGMVIPISHNRLYAVQNAFTQIRSVKT